MPRKVIVDGPGLAYHIYYRLLARDSISTAIDAVPTYHEIGLAFRAFLDALQDRNIIV